MSGTALLLMDFENAIMQRFGEDRDLFERLDKVAVAARKASIPVIYVVVKFREGYPEVSPNNKAFNAFKSSGMVMEEGKKETELSPLIKRQDGDILVAKRRVCAFTGSDLEVVLRAKQVDHLVLAGVSTSGVVLSTLRAAADMDYKLTVLSDCCLDKDQEVHRVLTTKVFTMQADVVTAEQWLKMVNEVVQR